MSTLTNSAVGSCGQYYVEHVRAGQVIWSGIADNQLYNEGQKNALQIWLAAASGPANWFIGLMKNSLVSLPARTSTLSTLNGAGPYELTNGSNSGYSARLQVNRDQTGSGWTTPTISGSGMATTAKTVTFTAGANWTDTVRWMFLTTVVTAGETTGLLISLAQLPADRLLLSGDQLNITYTLTLV